MKIVFDPAFLRKLKKLNARTRKSFKEKILLFSKNPNDLQIDNHALRDEYKKYRSIDITSDYRAIYEEITIGNEIVSYFIIIGTHAELYKKS